MNLKLISILAPIIGIYLATEFSYIHPDEHFQSIEVLAIKLFGIKGMIPWEFSSSHPARSFVPLYMYYGPIMYLWKEYLEPFPTTLLILFRLQNYVVYLFILNLCLQFLLESKLQRSKAQFFIYTSYITWCYQSHTFSNSLETVILLFTLSLFQTLIRDSRDPRFNHYKVSIFIGILISLGVFTRVSFPTFILLPFLMVFYKFYANHWKSFGLCTVSLLISFMMFIYLDTKIFGNEEWVIAPWNNFLYNLDESNLSNHGIHSRYTHLLVNLPQILGPLLIFFISPQQKITLPYLSAISGLVFLSIFRHQELRFLIPLAPLLFMSIDLSNFDKWINSKTVIRLWIIFNIVMSLITGVLHQSGVIRGITASHTVNQKYSGVHIWWKVYSPPTWMYMNDNLKVTTIDSINGKSINNIEFSIIDDHVVDLKGIHWTLLSKTIDKFLKNNAIVFLFAPDSMEETLKKLQDNNLFKMTPVWQTWLHLDLDHIDITDPKTIKPGFTIYNITTF